MRQLLKLIWSDSLLRDEMLALCYGVQLLTGRMVDGVSFPLSVEISCHQTEQQNCATTNAIGLYFSILAICYLLISIFCNDASGFV